MSDPKFHAKIKSEQAALQRELEEIRRAEALALKDEKLRRELLRRLEIADKRISEITELLKRL